MPGADGLWCSEPRRPKGGYWLSPQFHAWPEVQSLGLEAIGAYFDVGLWASSQRTAEIPFAATRLFRLRSCAVQQLVDVGLWAPFGDYGWLTKTPTEMRLREGRRGTVMLVSRLMNQCPGRGRVRSASIGLYAKAASWSLTTDDPAFIPLDVAREMGDGRTISALCSSGFWLPLGDGYGMSVGGHPLEADWALARDDERAPIPPEVRQLVYARDSYRCLHCSSSRHLSLDHIIPWSLGGPDTADNLQTLCRSCNSRKGARV